MKKLTATKDDRKNRRAAAAWATIAACAVVLLAQSCFAQSTEAKNPWQKMQMPTAAEVKQAWKTPPSEYGPEPYFG